MRVLAQPGSALVLPPLSTPQCVNAPALMGKVVRSHSLEWEIRRSSCDQEADHARRRNMGNAAVLAESWLLLLVLLLLWLLQDSHKAGLLDLTD